MDGEDEKKQSQGRAPTTKGPNEAQVHLDLAELAAWKHRSRHSALRQLPT
jgi:hypothetical protein